MNKKQAKKAIIGEKKGEKSKESKKVKKKTRKKQDFVV